MAMSNVSAVFGFTCIVLLGSILATASPAVHAQALALPDLTQVVLAQQQEALDAHIVLVEEQIAQQKRALARALTPDAPTPIPEVSVTALVASRGPAETGEHEIPMLPEMVVDETFLDPFDDETKDGTLADPWEPINARVFAFNRGVDRFVVKPIATGYHWVVPDVAEQALANAFQNLRVVPRVVNNLLQGKAEGAAVELGRFLINSTIGIAGLIDVADKGFGVSARDAEDAGQTLAVHGVSPGPYLVLPFLPPLTVRDSVGFLGDLALDPLNYVLPLLPQVSTRGGETVNTRSSNLDRFAGVEEGTLDLYSAVRDAYAQSRAKAIRN